MKKILLLMLLTLTCSLYGQSEKEGLPINDETGKISFEEVVEIEGSNKDELYDRGREWFITKYVSAEDVLQLEDKENGKLIGKAISSIPYKSMGANANMPIRYTIKIYFKEGRYKVVITDYLLGGLSANDATPIEEIVLNLDSKKKRLQKLYGQYKIGVLDAGNDLLKDLKTYMSKTTEIKKTDDW